jgi:hypothetical protein
MGAANKGPVKLQLEDPIVLGDKQIHELTIRKPKIGDDEAAEIAAGSVTTSQGIELLARLTGHPPKAIREMDSGDFDRAMEIVAGFRRRSQPTGGGESPA